MEQFTWIKSSKTKEHIIESVKGKDVDKIFDIGIKNNIPYLIQYAIENGIDPTRYDNDF